MLIGIAKEIKDNENRVALTPLGARKLVAQGHVVRVEIQAGEGSGFSDAEYVAAGAEIASCQAVWEADLLVKVKEPMPEEYARIKKQIIFTYFHLAGSDKRLTEILLQQETIAVAYETLEDDGGRLPLLAPMSAIAGNMATLMGAYYLAEPNLGKGVQLGSVLGERHGRVLVVGDGVVGLHSALVAYGMGANVTVLGLSDAWQYQLIGMAPSGIDYQLSCEHEIKSRLPETDLLIGAVLQHGAKAPSLITEGMVQLLKPGSVIVDVSIDQGGCIATSRPTSHSNPVFSKYDVVHYCVTNMPGAYPRTATIALTDLTYPYVEKLANHGLGALISKKGLIKAINTYKGYITNSAISTSLGMNDKYASIDRLL